MGLTPAEDWPPGIVEKIVTLVEESTERQLSGVVFVLIDSEGNPGAGGLNLGPPAWSAYGQEDIERILRGWLEADK